MKTKRVGEGRDVQKVRFLNSREKVLLLFRFPGDRTVGFLRDKKESCYTRRGLRVGTGFKEFRQTP